MEGGAVKEWVSRSSRGCSGDMEFDMDSAFCCFLLPGVLTTDGSKSDEELVGMAKDFNIVGEGRNQVVHAACCWHESDRWHQGCGWRFRQGSDHRSDMREAVRLVGRYS